MTVTATPPGTRKSRQRVGCRARPVEDSRRAAADVDSRKWEDPDVRLMLRVREDDQEAFAELLARYGSRIFGHFFRVLGDRQDAEDLTQEVFLRVYRSRKRYQPRARFATWLFHITQNVARNAIRSRRRHPSVQLEVLGSADDNSLLESLLFDRGEEPSRPVERAEVARVVRDAVSGLAGRQRTAVELHQFEDRTYNEVAARMDMSPEAAKSLLYRARNQLRESLSVYMGELC
jgi:RNA polymerase sigma-70 factor, ECF subfamily